MAGFAVDGKVGRCPVELAEELRTPLTVILNVVHLLTLSRDDATIEQALRIVTGQVDRLADLADELGEALRAERENPG